MSPKRNTRVSGSVNDFGTHVTTSYNESTVEPFNVGKPIGDSFFEKPDHLNTEFQGKPLNYGIK